MNPLMSSTTMLQRAQGVVRRHCRPQRRLGEPGWRYLAPVEGCLHGFSLAEGDFGLDLQLYLVCCRLAFELAANVVLLERALELRQRHAFDKRGAVGRNLAHRAGVAPRPGSLLSFRILMRTSLAPSRWPPVVGPQSLAPSLLPPSLSSQVLCTLQLTPPASGLVGAQAGEGANAHGCLAWRSCVCGPAGPDRLPLCQVPSLPPFFACKARANRPGPSPRRWAPLLEVALLNTIF